MACPGVRSSVVEGRISLYTLKQGVSIHMTPEIEKMLYVICMVFRAFDLPVIITSAIDGPHRQDSLHYKFRAFDIRKNFIDVNNSNTWSMHYKDIIDGLHIQFKIKGYPVNVVNEADHLHFEWAGI